MNHRNQTLIASALCGVAALISLAFMWHVGHANPSVLLQLLFAAWVVSPFAALAAGSWASRGWSRPAQVMLSGVLLAVAVLSPLLYARSALDPTTPHPAFVFLMLPLASWCLGIVAVGAAYAVSRRRR
jgi:hypothetical protein